MATLLNKITRDDLLPLTGLIDVTQQASTDEPEPFPDGYARFDVSLDQLGPQYNDEENIDSRYEFFEGILQIPVAGPPGTPSVLVAVHAPYATRVVQWTVGRMGGKPRIPDPTPTTPNQTRGYMTFTPAAPTLTPDGTRYFRVSGLYTFYLTAIDPYFPQSMSLVAGKLSFDPSSSFYYTLDSTQFDPTLIPSL